MADDLRPTTPTEAADLDRWFAEAAAQETEHCVRDATPKIITGNAWCTAAVLTLHGEGPGLWFAALADVQDCEVVLAVDDEAMPTTRVRIMDRSTVAYPLNLGPRWQHRCWLHAPCPAGHHKVELRARAEAGLIRHVAIWATATDPGARRPGEMFGRGR